MFLPVARESECILRNVVTRIVSLRMRKRIGPLQLAVLCDVTPFDGLPGAEAVSA